ncbi:endoglucanase-1, variant [Thelonectria olida]|uniref:Endoglucanase-1, variant n=1 Tax=Thelonectria olida TaxID=1576542 RepID=A0A9P8VUP4_9HYPO|nr:endoglucanase-1, variant [Thelonectria olida]
MTGTRNASRCRVAETRRRPPPSLCPRPGPLSLPRFVPSTPYAYYSTRDYSVLNNLWGIDTATSGSQCTYYYGPATGGGIAFGSDWRWVGNENTVKSYIYANRAFNRRRISEINRLPTIVQWSYNVTNTRANVAYDIFTDRDINHDHSSGEYEIMIWLAVYGGVWPITDSGEPVAQVTLAKHTWKLYTGWNTAWNPPMRVYSFLPANGAITSFSGNVMEFFRYLTTAHSFPAATQYMLMYQFDTEAFTGGPANFDVPLFEANVE